MKRMRRHRPSPSAWRAALVGLSLAASLPASAQQDLDQKHYRWRNDDGTEATATFTVAEDNKIPDVGKNTIQRLRLEVSNEGALSSGAVNFELQVAETAVCSAPTAAAKTFAAGYASTCVLLVSGEIQCWGYNGQGQLGDGTTIDRWSRARYQCLTGYGGLLQLLRAASDRGNEVPGQQQRSRARRWDDSRSSTVARVRDRHVRRDPIHGRALPYLCSSSHG